MSLVVATAARANADTQGVDFESYNTGSVNGQDSWTSTGAYDQAVVDNSTIPGAPASFNTKSLRISDAVTTDSFGDQTFSKPTSDEAGEPTADSGAYSSGTRRSNFLAGFDLASVTPGTEQTGLHMSVSPDRGDGSRMSYLRIEDSPSGWNMFFDDYQDAAPLGSPGNLDDGCGPEDNFTDTQVATGIATNVVHHITFAMQFVPGGHNDIVNVLLDGNVIATGTSWEDYYRYCSDSGGGTGGPLADKSRTVRRLLFRESGTADPLNAGKGFLIDNLSIAAVDGCTTTCYVNATAGSDAYPGTLALPKATIQAGIDAVSANGTVRVMPGNYNETAANESPASIPGTYTFGLFLSKPGITVEGVHSDDAPITSHSDPAMPVVTTNSTADFGPDGVFVEGNNDTISGLHIGENLPSGSCNKSIEVVGDGFTFANGIVDDPCGGDIYIDDFRYDSGTGTPYVNSYTITGSEFGQGNTIDIASGAGHGTPASNRQITNNLFDGGAYYPSISFNGADSGIPYFVYPVGGATITGNTFLSSDQYIRARGTYDTATFNWNSYFLTNTFTGAAMTKTPGGDVQTYSYTAPGASWANVRRINGTLQKPHGSGCAGADCNGDIDNALAGDTVFMKGTIHEDVTLTKAVSLLGTGAPTLVSVNTGVTVNSPGTLNIRGINFTGATPSIGIEHNSALPVISNNSIESLINVAPGTVDARCNWWGSASGPSSGQIFGHVMSAPFLTSSSLASSCTPIANLGTSAIQTVEGNSGTHPVNLTVTLNGPSTTNATVTWNTASGTAGIGDLMGGNGTLVFTPGQTTKTITVQVKGDTTLEQNETFSVQIHAGQGAAVGVDHQTVVIQNDELPTLVVTAAPTSVSEGSSVAYNVKLAQQYYQPVTVTIQSVNGTAASPGDFPAVSRTVTFAAGTTGPIPLPALAINMDGVNESAEKFSLSFTSPQINAPKSVIITIKANNT